MPLQLHHRRLGQHSPVHSSAAVGDPWRPNSHLPTPAPPPPSSTERPFGCGALWAPSSTRVVALQPVQPAPVAPRAGQHSLRPGAPPPARGTPSAVGSLTHPAWQHHLCRRQSRSAGLTQACHVPPPSGANRQWWSGWVACPCDVEVGSPRPHLPRRAQPGGGQGKNHPGRRNFNPVGGGQVSRLKKKTPKVEKVPGWVGCSWGPKF